MCGSGASGAAEVDLYEYELFNCIQTP
jgi:hypothetical protein